MSKQKTGKNVFEAAKDRIRNAYKQGCRVIVAFSAGKDSTCCMELTLQVARELGKLPIEVMFRDDEIMYPGTFEYAERVYRRTDEIKMDWISNRQPGVNLFNRACPYYWVFDWEMPPEQWVRTPPDWIQWRTEHMSLYILINTVAYPVAPKQFLCAIVGIRTAESKNRSYAIQSAKGARSYDWKTNDYFSLYPIYDWEDGDVWKAINDNKWDYNEAYDVMAKMGVSRKAQRIAPISMSTLSVDSLRMAASAWPRWFDRVSNRLPGIRGGVQFGIEFIQPTRRIGETWEQCFTRECLVNAPEWISKRAEDIMMKMLTRHATHSTEPFPEVSPCRQCGKVLGSWKEMAAIMYSGDPIGVRQYLIKDVQPSFFRPTETRDWVIDRPTPKRRKEEDMWNGQQDS